jgi:hypothetical protein
MELEQDKQLKSETETNIKEKILIKNNYFSFIREKKNHYRINCIIENNNINAETLFNINLLQFMYSVNKDLFEIIEFNATSENEVNLYLLIKPLFKSLGILQRFVSLKIIQTNINDSVIFNGVSNIEYGLLRNQSKNAIIAPIYNIIIQCNPIHSGKFELVTYIKLEDNFVFPSMIEKMVGTIFKKVYKNIISGIQSLQ